MSIKRTEHEEQVLLFNRCNQHKDQYPELEWAYAVPNAGKRSYRMGSYMKAEGLRSGVPDVCLPVARQGYGSLYIEMKLPKKKPTDNQKKWIEGLKALGNKVEICYSHEEAWRVILDYLGYVEDEYEHGQLFKDHT